MPAAWAAAWAATTTGAAWAAAAASTTSDYEHGQQQQAPPPPHPDHEHGRRQQHGQPHGQQHGSRMGSSTAAAAASTTPDHEYGHQQLFTVVCSSKKGLDLVNRFINGSAPLPKFPQPLDCLVPPFACDSSSCCPFKAMRVPHMPRRMLALPGRCCQCRTGRCCVVDPPPT